MHQSESFSNSLYTDQMHLAERELSAFIAAVTELFGAEHARLSAEPAEVGRVAGFLKSKGFTVTSVGWPLF